MSFTGKNPSYKWLTLEPQAADPTSPNEGDIFRSDGTSRDEGLWVYESAAWTQISTGATLSVLANLTLTPQSADPGSPVSGMLFVSDGTSRAAGLWEYNGTNWTQVTGVKYQELTLKQAVVCRVATTVAGILASDFDNGSTVDGVIIATNDVILVKNQSTASENGVYTVNASGAPTRHSSADTFSELNNGYTAYIDTSGTTNKNTQWFQTATLTSLSDNQTWATTPATYSVTVPAGVYNMNAFLVGGGGGGGGTDNTNSGGGGGGGRYSYHSFVTTPGESLTITIGKGGLGSGKTSSTTGASGGTSSVSGTFGTISAIGGGGGGDTGIGGLSTLFTDGGSGGQQGGGGGGGGIAYIGNGGDGTTGVGNPGIFMTGGSGGGASQNGGTGGISEFISTASTGGASPSTRGGGGGGGASFGAGANGTDGTTGLPVTPVQATGYGGGGSGGGGSGTGCFGGLARNGYVKISW